ncbi:MAG: YbjN domain-containing protein [Clostridia bacterium]|nr:YbjN domain-containing protein [Clostridia bacterium]
MLACAELFTKFLESKGLNFNVREDSDGDVFVMFPYDGKITRCIFSGEEGKYLSLYLVYENVPEDKMADAIFLANELNTKWKWVKFYVDGDRDLMLQDDAILSVDTAADEAFELLLRMLNIGKDSKPSIMKALYA